MGSTLKAAAIAAITLSSNQLSIFQLDSNNALQHKSLTGSTWSSGWNNLGGTFSSIPSVTSWGSSNMECIGVGTDTGAWGRSWNGNGWGDWYSHGGTWKYPLHMVTYGGKYLEYYGTGTDNTCWHQSYNGNSWSGFDNIGGTFVTGISVTTTVTGAIDIYGVGNDGNCWHRYRPSSSGSWGGWDNRGSPPGGVFISEIVVISISINIQFICGIGYDNAMWYNQRNGSSWSGWESLGGNFGSMPSVSPWGSGFSCLGTGTDGSMYHRSWSPSGDWQPSWESIGTGFRSAPTTTSWGSGFQCFGRRSDGIYHRSWGGSSWSNGWVGPL